MSGCSIKKVQRVSIREVQLGGFKLFQLGGSIKGVQLGGFRRFQRALRSVPMMLRLLQTVAEKSCCKQLLEKVALQIVAANSCLKISTVHSIFRYYMRNVQ